MAEGWKTSSLTHSSWNIRSHVSPLSTPIDMCVVSPNFTHLGELLSHRVSDSLPLVTSSKSHTTQLCDDLCHHPESPVPIREPDYRKIHKIQDMRSHMWALLSCWGPSRVTTRWACWIYWPMRKKWDLRTRAWTLPWLPFFDFRL